MLRIIFQNLDKSSLVMDSIRERVESLEEKFTELKASNLSVYVSRENSPLQAGPDLFRVKFKITGGKYSGLIFEKEAPNFYLALSEVNEGLLERLNRFGDKKRVLARRRAKKSKEKLSQFVS